MLGTVWKHYKGGMMQKIIGKNFRPPPPHSPPPKKFQPSLFAMKIAGQPHRKACKINF